MNSIQHNVSIILIMSIFILSCESYEQTSQEEDAIEDIVAPEPQPTPTEPTWTVTNIVDGDTIDVINSEGTSERVRLIGIDTPERGECGYNRASNFIEALTLDKEVILTSGIEQDRDQYDRILRYVDLDEIDVGLELISQGLAISRYDSRDGYDRHNRESLYIVIDETTEQICNDEQLDPNHNPWNTESCDPAYTPCVPPVSETGDLNCPDIRMFYSDGVSVDHSNGDPHALDRDKDGTACAN